MDYGNVCNVVVTASYMDFFTEYSEKQYASTERIRSNDAKTGYRNESSEVGIFIPRVWSCISFCLWCKASKDLSSSTGFFQRRTGNDFIP